MSAPSAYQVEQVIAAWQSARARLLQDPDLMADEEALTALLGPQEGDVREILARLLRAAAHAKGMADMANSQVSNLRARKDRFKRRSEQLRAAAHSIMELLGLSRVELPDATASVRSGRPSVAITDEAAIPDEYVRIKREPDKAALLEALRHGEIIPGAALNNSPPTIQIRGN